MRLPIADDVDLDEEEVKVAHWDPASDEGWQPLETEVDVSQFAGETVTMRAKTDGEAHLDLQHVGFVVDTRGDGIPDEFAEMDLEMPAGPPGVRGTPLAIDPTTRDTINDGLDDGDQVDIEWKLVEVLDGQWGIQAEVDEVRAHPALRDTINNNFTDREEFENGTNPLKWDYAGDGIPDGDDPHPQVHNGWTVNIWTAADTTTRGPSEGPWEMQARTALEEELSSQIDLKVENGSRPDVEVKTRGLPTEDIVDCNDDSGTLTNFQEWLEESGKVQDGEYRMLIVSCVGVESIYHDGKDGIFMSRNDPEGNLTHKPDDGEYASGLVNTRVTHLEPGQMNRFRATVIHEFGHAALDNEECEKGDHSCGGITEDGEQTPMILANVKEILREYRCIGKNRGPVLEEEPIGYGIFGEFTTEITPCTKQGLEKYHDQ